jgi:uncharacterized circularly permuted ATP-grasp superfamily protein/uncharacterized alpha-E superfamily protein
MDAGLDNPTIGAYRLQPGVYDEMLTPQGEIRAHWHYLANALGTLGIDALNDRWREARHLLRESGVTYNVYGDPQGLERPWQIDPIPVVVPSDEWRDIEVGLLQRAEVLDLVLKDLYGPQELIQRGLLPLELVYGHGGFLRACYGIRPPATHALTLYAADLARAPDGRLCVLSDRTQAPSGAGYALENRVVMARILPSLFRDSHVHRLALYFQNMRASLAALSPRKQAEPRVVVLTPGSLNETYFEHIFLAGYLGYTLVSGDDLAVQDGRVWLRAMRRLEPVDVILRRVDDHFCDPLELYADSRLGVPGLTEAVRRGTVAVANPLGSSLLENPGLNAYLPAIARHYLGRELALPSVETWWCGDPVQCKHVLANLDRLVVRPIYRHVGSRPLFGGLLSSDERAALAARIRAHPHGFVGQEQLTFSSVPALTPGGLEARRAVIRTFLVARDDGYVVMPGALTRVAGSQDNVLVSNQAGGVSKDTWILATEPEKQVSLLAGIGRRMAIVEMRTALPGGAADNLFWLGRYAERAEQSARLVRTAMHVYRNAIEYHDPVDRACLADLLPALTHVTATYPGFAYRAVQGDDAIPELLAVVLDSHRVGSISFTLQAMLNAAYSLRDRLSSDTWRVVNGVRVHYERLQGRPRDELDDVEDDLDELVTELVALLGTAQESMIRGQAWLFLDSGRRLERALMLTALLRATVIARREPQTEDQLLDSVLRATASLMSYRRGYHEQPQLERVLGLLLFDEANPRSLAFQLNEIQEALATLPREEGRVQMSEESRLLLDASSRLRLAELSSLLTVDPTANTRVALDALLAQLGVLLAQASDLLTRHYFVDVRGPQQLARLSSEAGG